VKNYLACIKFRKQQSALYHATQFSVGDMLNQKKFADLVFTFPSTGHQLYAHRSVLALRSMYFRTMFSFAEQTHNTSSSASSSSSSSTALQRPPKINRVTSTNGNGNDVSDAKGEWKRQPIMSSTVLSAPPIVGSATPHTGSINNNKRPRPPSPTTPPSSTAAPLSTSTTSSTTTTFDTPRPFVHVSSSKDRTSSSLSLHMVRGLDEDDPTHTTTSTSSTSTLSITPSTSLSRSVTTVITPSSPTSSSMTAAVAIAVASSVSGSGSSSSQLSPQTPQTPTGPRMCDGRHEVVIEDIDYHVFYRMIAYIYGTVPHEEPMSYPILRQLLSLASRYLLEELRMECGRILMWFVAEDSCIELLQDAVQNNV
jgi:hypothetical protein